MSEGSKRPAWDFHYAPLPTAAADDDGAACDALVALDRALPEEDVAAALPPWLEEPEVELVVSEDPIFWYRLRSPSAARRADVKAALERGLGAIAGDAHVRYVASALRPSTSLGPALDLRSARARSRSCARGLARWPARPRGARPRSNGAGALREPDPDRDGLWFLGSNGVHVSRRICGAGAGMRLAVIDDDAGDVEHLDLEGEVCVGVAEPPRAHGHGALMVAWATRSRRELGFEGVAPHASARVYYIPKAGRDVVSVARAIVRAAADGADVIVCSTYVEGTTSPMLDDALAFAAAIGRRGRGTAVVLPTGREASSPPGSIHASWTLGLGEPASDPRAICIAPSSRDGDWFLWPDRRGRLRPFANRGPAVRWLAPGDDIEFPFGRRRLFHAESSGAAAIAAGVLLLVLGANPRLSLPELEAAVSRTVAPASGTVPEKAHQLADVADVAPHAVDPDGHNARWGYGRLDARRACITVADPLAAALDGIGEAEAALRVAEGRGRIYSRALGRWAARAALRDRSVDHAFRALARHARLVAARSDRAAMHGPCALVRSLAVLLSRLDEGSGLPLKSRRVRAELAQLTAAARARAGAVDRAWSAAEAVAIDALFAAPVTGQAVEVVNRSVAPAAECIVAPAATAP